MMSRIRLPEYSEDNQKTILSALIKLLASVEVICSE